MAYGIFKYMDAAAELGRNPGSKHQVQPGYGDEQADAGRDCRTRLARPSSQPHTLAICITIHAPQLALLSIFNFRSNILITVSKKLMSVPWYNIPVYVDFS